MQSKEKKIQLIIFCEKKLKNIINMILCLYFHMWLYKPDGPSYKWISKAVC